MTISKYILTTLIIILYACSSVNKNISMNNNYVSLENKKDDTKNRVIRSLYTHGYNIYSVTDTTIITTETTYCRLRYIIKVNIKPNAIYITPYCVSNTLYRNNDIIIVNGITYGKMTYYGNNSILDYPFNVSCEIAKTVND